MKRILPQATSGFLCAIAATRDQECDCQECVHLVGELAEVRHSGGALTPNLELALQHLKVCPECLEEYDALERALKAAAG